MQRRKFKSAVSAVLVIVLIFTGLFGYNICMKYMYPLKYNESVERYSENYGVDISLVYSVIRTESGFKPKAESNVGAKGLMQITPDTFEWLMTKTGENYEIVDLYDPDVNIKYGTLFLSMLIAEFGDKKLALSAYHAGRGQVNDWLCDPEISDGSSLTRIPYKDTEHYVNKVQKAEQIYLMVYDLEER